MIRKLLGLIGKIRFFLAIVFVALAVGAVSARKIDVRNVEANETIADVNGDGRINLVDARILAPPDMVSCQVCVDINGDKTINQADADIVQEYADIVATIVPDTTVPKYKSRFDVNGDKIIDAKDVAIIQHYFGQMVEAPVFGLENPSELTFGFMANDILIKFKPETTDSEKQAVFAKYNLNQKKSFEQINTSNLATGNDNVENLQKQLALEPTILSSKKSSIMEFATDDPRWDDQWGHKKIRVEETWWAGATTGRTPNKVRVAIIDTGADYNHYDLGANLSQTARRNVDIDPVWGFDQQDVTDEAGHGTHIAGIIGATANNNQGVAGLNWNVEIVPIKAAVLNDTTGEWELPLPYLYLATEWAALNHDKFDILNMSYSNPGVTSDENVDYYLRALHNEYGIILIGAAGNDTRNDCDYPAVMDEVVCVGATGQNDALCASSSGRQDADILAPGRALSTVPTNVSWDVGQDGVEWLGCGTSISTAYVSGVTALCLSVAPSNARRQFRCDQYQHNGYGRIDAYATIWYHNCYRFDMDGNKNINVWDLMRLARNSSQPYNVRYDVYPVGGDGRIDRADAYLAALWHAQNCQ